MEVAVQHQLQPQRLDKPARQQGQVLLRRVPLLPTQQQQHLRAYSVQEQEPQRQLEVRNHLVVCSLAALLELEPLASVVLVPLQPVQ